MPYASRFIVTVIMFLSASALGGVPSSAPPAPRPNASSTAALPEGFRGLAWGTLVLADMRPLPEASQIPGIRRYMRPADTRSLGGVGVDGPVCGYVSGRLRDVSFFIEPADVAALRIYLEKAWGPSESVNGHPAWVSPNRSTGAQLVTHPNPKLRAVLEIFAFESDD